MWLASVNIWSEIHHTRQRDPIIADELPAEHKERRTWTPTDDLVLISSWLNTSKDPVVGNDQKGRAFWTRIAAYFFASPKLAGCEKREASQRKHRWHKLNELVSKFCWAYEAATREKTSGMNENDVIKAAHEIYYNNNKKKFTIEHAWKELRTDQKCSKRRKFEDGSHTASSAPDEVTCRPPGVKAAKARGKKALAEGKNRTDFEAMWKLKEVDFDRKEKLSKMKVLESLVARGEGALEVEGSRRNQYEVKCRVVSQIIGRVVSRDESLDDAFDELFDQHFEQAFEEFKIHGDQEERKKTEKNELISKEIVKKDIIVYGMIISVKLPHILKISSDNILE
uniref:Myb-like domain-containing protein n=1 Tax=Brassica oleracea TaxID=3712 RepID=A0A3P6DI87_BRAOL|nr:unnamed protein product [Brassica oleracea]